MVDNLKFQPTKRQLAAIEAGAVALHDYDSAPVVASAPTPFADLGSEEQDHLLGRARICIEAARGDVRGPVVNFDQAVERGAVALFDADEDDNDAAAAADPELAAEYAAHGLAERQRFEDAGAELQAAFRERARRIIVAAAAVAIRERADG
jgi:hypothetical protein